MLGQLSETVPLPLHQMTGPCLAHTQPLSHRSTRDNEQAYILQELFWDLYKWEDTQPQVNLYMYKYNLWRNLKLVGISLVLCQFYNCMLECIHQDGHS